MSDATRSIPGGRILRAVSLLVPAESRREWLREWSVEVLYTWGEGAGRSGRFAARVRCLGSLEDAIRLRWRQREKGMLWQDLRYAVRVFYRQPGLTLAVALTLALGIGANTAVFSLIHAVLLRPLPFGEPERLVVVESVDTESGDVLRNSIPDVADWRREARSFVDLAVYFVIPTQITGAGPAESVTATWLTPEFLPVLGVEPVLGRNLLPEENVPGGDVFKVLISHGLWRSRYGADPAVLGRTIELSRRAYEIVGVLPPGIRYPLETDVWAPMHAVFDAVGIDARTRFRERRWNFVIGRLAADADLEDARAEMATLGARLEVAHPESNEGIRPRVTSLREAEAGRLRPYLLALFGAAGFVLLVACANVANLLLTRSLARRREMAIRGAMGASAGRLARQLLTESVLLSAWGGLLGVFLAFFGMGVVLDLIPVELPFWMKIEIDAPVLLFTLALTVLTSVACGVFPAVQSRRSDLAESLGAGARGATGERYAAGLGRLGLTAGRLRQGLVVAEIALSLMLLIGAGLLLSSFLRLRAVDPGFEPEHVMTASVVPNPPFFDESFSERDRVEWYLALYGGVIDKLRALPGVSAAGGSRTLPYLYPDRGRRESEVSIRGESEEPTRIKTHAVDFLISPDYPEVMGIPLLAGRGFLESDTLDAPRVAMVSRRAARLLWPGEDPIGKELRIVADEWLRVVGVVGDVKYGPREGDGGVEVYVPYTQWNPESFHFVMRATGDPDHLAAAMRQAVAEVHEETAVTRTRSLTGIVAEAIWQPRLLGFLCALFAGLALVLAAIGVYGVMSYSVGRRTREVGIRIAVGARRGDVVRALLAEGMALVGAGIGLGLGAALALTRFLSSVLFEVRATDPATFAGLPLLLSAVALAACLVPALRASRNDPVTALRSE